MLAFAATFSIATEGCSLMTGAVWAGVADAALVLDPEMTFPRTGITPVTESRGRVDSPEVGALNGSVLVGPGDGTGAFSTAKSLVTGMGLVWTSPGDGAGAFSTLRSSVGGIGLVCISPGDGAEAFSIGAGVAEAPGTGAAATAAGAVSFRAGA